MADCNAILIEMRQLRESDFARYCAEILDNVRDWHRRVLANPDGGRLWV